MLGTNYIIQVFNGKINVINWNVKVKIYSVETFSIKI